MEIKNMKGIDEWDERDGEIIERTIFVLNGWCQEKGHLSDGEITSEIYQESEPCPSCGLCETCDVYWKELQPFNNRDIERVISEFEGDGGCNIFPGGVPGPFNPRLVIFVDYPGIEKGDILAQIRKRVLWHLSGQRTEEIIFVSRHKSTMQRMFGIKDKFGQLVKEWRFMDSTFAPLIQFRDEYSGWYRFYCAESYRI